MFLLAIAIEGCSVANGIHELLPTAEAVHKKTTPFQKIEIYTQDNLPVDKGYVFIAKVAAHGNAYASNETLKETIRKEASKVGAELVLLTGENITNDESIGSYGGGIYISDQIKRPHLYGLAAVYSKVKFGTVTGNDGYIKYIRSGSSADKAGLREGMKILSINGRFFQNNLVMQTEVSAKKPGDIVTIEYMDNENEKKIVRIVLEAAQ